MDAKEIFNKRSDRQIKFLFKSFLEILEEIQATHEINFDKLKDSLPEEYHELIEMADYFDESHYEIYRKKILDLGNSVLRDYNSELENFVIEFRFN